MRKTKEDKEIDRLFKKRVGDLTISEMQFLFVYFGIMKKEEQLTVYLVPKNKSKVIRKDKK